MNNVAAAVLAAVLALPDVAGTRVFTFKDASITESSALIDLGSLMVTTNDSGGGPLIYVIDSRTGRTVATTTYTDQVVDTEALAPDDRDHVWVGDVGDNNAVRSSVQVYRVPVAGHDLHVRAPRYDLVYPDGAHDAESLLYGPDGRLRIITKSILGGRVYVAPKHLDPNQPNRLRAGPAVDLFATDAALLPDGKHVLVRGYGGALLTTFPGFRDIAEFGLPSQQQGEGISVGPSGRIRLSSEGVHSPVLQIRLPVAVRRILAGRPAFVPRSRGHVVPGGETGVTGLDLILLAGIGALGSVALVVRRRRR